MPVLIHLIFPKLISIGKSVCYYKCAASVEEVLSYQELSISLQSMVCLPWHSMKYSSDISFAITISLIFVLFSYELMVGFQLLQRNAGSDPSLISVPLPANSHGQRACLCDEIN